MADKPPRVRFAPSPTGYLHVGGARTALFNWLFARRTGGTMILRIEDTDQDRSTAEHTQVILDGLAWLGIEPYEGPYFQADHTERHRGDAERLLAENKAYRCFCTKDELAAAREEAARRKTQFRYDRRCDLLSQDEVARRLDQQAPFVIRFRMPDEEIAWHDMIHGSTSFQGRDLDDLVILRSNGTPIYNLAVVSDDHDMAISHVIRGDDHLSNTPKQIALYRALEYPVPAFAHVPMILGADGKKLSKRHGATAVGDYQHAGILPRAMRNFLALLGWSPGGDDEILDEAELISRFALEDVHKKPAVFDTQKLEWMNGQYLSQLPAAELRQPVIRVLEDLGVSPPDEDRIALLIDTVKTRARTVTQLGEQIAVRLDGSRVQLDPKGEKLIRKMAERYHANLALAVKALEETQDWQSEALNAELHSLAERSDLKLGDVMQPIRVALTGGTVSEPVDQLLAVVGRDQSLARLRAAVDAAGD